MIYPKRTLKPKQLPSGVVSFTRRTIWPSVLLLPPSLGLVWLSIQMIRLGGAGGLFGWVVLAGAITLALAIGRWSFLREAIVHNPQQGSWTHHFGGLFSSKEESYQSDEVDLLLTHTFIFSSYVGGRADLWICQVRMPHGKMILSTQECCSFMNTEKSYNKILDYTRSVADVLGIPYTIEDMEHNKPIEATPDGAPHG